MNKTQAGHWLTLAWYLRTRVSRNLFDMRAYGREVERRRPNGDLQHCGTSSCALGYCSHIWPDRFVLTPAPAVREGVPPGVGYMQLVSRNGYSAFESASGNDALRAWFGTLHGDIVAIFGSQASTPKRKAAQIERMVREHGWDYA